MSDHLRERIANVLLPDLEYAAAYNPIQDPQEQAYTLADAVIAELQPELSSLDRLTQWQYAPRLPMHYLMPDGSDPGFTNWKADDE